MRISDWSSDVCSSDLAAVSIDAIFIGKLMAMLAMSLVGIAIWGSVAFLIYLASFGGTAPLPAPAVGWPLFAGLGVIYFAMAYMLLGSLFIGIGAQARSEGHTYELQSLMSISYAVFCLKKKKKLITD